MKPFTEQFDTPFSARLSGIFQEEKALTKL